MEKNRDLHRDGPRKNFSKNEMKEDIQDALNSNVFIFVLLSITLLTAHFLDDTNQK